jgi:imidazole glycerol-phosphate synthase subunit HisH
MKTVANNANTVAVVDYGMGNLHSVAQAVRHAADQVGVEVFVTSDPEVVRKATRVVLPGQGAMPDCMRELDARGLRGAVIQSAKNKPWLGICIGLQMLFEHSEEGNMDGLAVFPGRVVRFPSGQMQLPDGTRLKVPHMGWNEVQQRESHPLWGGIKDNSRFYFVHSYYVVPTDGSIAAGRTHYGLPFTSAAARDNIFAVQFHPEKSAQAGLQLLSNFMQWNP